jgi:hypothetical protein
LKHDGFRGILYVDRDHAWLVSRKIYAPGCFWIASGGCTG